MSNFFSGKIVLVTGGTHGIGKAAALAFVRNGSTVIICGRDSKTGEMITKDVEHLNGLSEFIEADISDAKQVDTLFSRIREKYKRLDCAFNAAGTEAELAPLALQTEKHFNEMVSVDLKGTWLCMKNEIRIMQDQGKGSIVNDLRRRTNGGTKSPDDAKNTIFLIEHIYDRNYGLNHTQT